MIDALVIGLAVVALIVVMTQLAATVLVVVAVFTLLSWLPSWVLVVIVLAYVGLQFLEDRMVDEHCCPACGRSFCNVGG